MESTLITPKGKKTELYKYDIGENDSILAQAYFFFVFSLHNV